MLRWGRVTDFYPSFDKLRYRGQKCLLHLLRNPERVESKRGKRLTGEFRRFASRLRELVRDAVEASGESPCRRALKKSELERRLRSLYSRRYHDRNCRRICKLFRKHGNKLFTFLKVEDLSWNNNEAERALRPSVVVRKNSYGSKSELGTRNHAILMTIGETCKRHKMNFMQFGRNYMQSRICGGFGEKVTIYSYFNLSFLFIAGLKRANEPNRPVMAMPKRPKARATSPR